MGRRRDDEGEAGMDENKPKVKRVRLPPTKCIAVDSFGAAALIDISRGMWMKLNANGQVPQGRRLGKCVRWSVAELKAWAAAGMPGRIAWERIKERGA